MSDDGGTAERWPPFEYQDALSGPSQVRRSRPSRFGGPDADDSPRRSCWVTQLPSPSAAAGTAPAARVNDELMMLARQKPLLEPLDASRSDLGPIVIESGLMGRFYSDSSAHA